MKVRSLGLQICLFAAMALGLLACASPQKPNAHQQSRSVEIGYTVVGKLLGHDGHPMAVAHVHAGEQTVAADPNGRFRITLAPRDFHLLRFAGVNHAVNDVLLYHKGGEFELDVHLGTYARAEGPVGFVTFREPFDKKRARVSKRVAAEARPDGTFVAELQPENGRIAYEVTGFAEGHYINGSQASSFVYDNDGDYMAVIETRKPVQVTIDPQELAPAGKETRHVVAEPNGVTAGLLNIQKEIQNRQQAFEKTVVKHLETGKGHFAQPPNPAHKDELATRSAEATDSVLKAALLIAYFAVPGACMREHTLPSDQDRTLAREALTVIPADSLLWSIAPLAPGNLAAALDVGPKETAYFDRLIRSRPREKISTEILMCILCQAQARGDKTSLRHFALIMATEYPDSNTARMARQFDPDRRIRSGQPLPAFELPALSSDAKKHNNDSIRGKTVLIKFWATWCKPCWVEMPELHEVFKKYEKRGDFSILSVSVNSPREAFDSFRKDKWAMPWQHAVLDTEQSHVATELFGVFSLPTSILVGPDGTILATSFELRAGLTATLERHLKKKDSTGASRPATSVTTRPTRRNP